MKNIIEEEAKVVYILQVVATYPLILDMPHTFLITIEVITHHLMYTDHQKIPYKLNQANKENKRQ